MGASDDWDYPEEPECPAGKEMDPDCLAAREAGWDSVVKGHRNDYMNALDNARRTYFAAAQACANNAANAPVGPCQAAARATWASTVANLAQSQKDQLDHLRNMEQLGCKADCCVTPPEEEEEQ